MTKSYNIDISDAQAREFMDAQIAAAKARAEELAKAEAEAGKGKKPAAAAPAAKKGTAAAAPVLPYDQTVHDEEIKALIDTRVAFLALYKGDGAEAVNEARWGSSVCHGCIETGFFLVKLNDRNEWSECIRYGEPGVVARLMMTDDHCSCPDIIILASPAGVSSDQRILRSGASSLIAFAPSTQATAAAMWARNQAVVAVRVEPAVTAA